MRIGVVRELWRFPVKSMGGESLARTTIGALGIPGDRGWAVRDEAAGEIRGAKKLPALMQCTARYRTEPGDADVPHADLVLADGSRSATDDPDVHARLSTVLGRRVTLWARRPPDDRDHYRRGLPDDPDMERELRAIFGRTPEEPLPDLSTVPPELFEYTSPLGTYFDVAPIHLLTDAALAFVGAPDRRRFRPNVLVATGHHLRGLVEEACVGRTIAIGAAAVRADLRTMRCAMVAHAQPGLPKDPGVLRAVVRDADQCLGLYASVITPGRVAVGDPVAVLS